ncbi:hypothetical protein SNE25_20310 [Mucilaginibacter sabulilitoris]|uniref:Uncharacterized protein n=1 Tax=Mucilaginibacter sabulilitoris TaxID=1173583 RepID=A0ABZ0TEQ1_9SPHI|nr:hypothetical protein [Mucilaginibacter sabulilitoris]WPU91665.1 hypothetical protein SNE25_20310 [Mucilaginibacter sabulilitoris]
MIKLINMLMVQYQAAGKIYLSRDAASWHSSRSPHAYIKAVNEPPYRDLHQTPFGCPGASTYIFSIFKCD